MKLVTIALLAASATAALAQSAVKPNSTTDLESIPQILQTGCPVVFTNVALERKGHLMQVKQGGPQNDGLSFRYENKSGKKIQSIGVRVDLRVKKSAYDLDATPVTLDMTLTGGGADEKLSLPPYTYGLGHVALQQVTYADGTVWTANQQQHRCGYDSMNSGERIGKFQ